MKKCPKCGSITDSKFCPECGTDLSEVKDLKVCPNCGKETNSKFCPECGTEVKLVSKSEKKIDVKNEKEKPSDGIEVNAENDAKKEDGSIEINQTVPTAQSGEKAQKQMSKKMKIAAIAAAVVVLLAIGAALGGGGNDSSSTPTEEPTTEEPATEETIEEPEEETSSFDYSSIFGEFTKEEDYEDLNYDNIARNPDDYKGKKYKGSGTVLQVLESDSEVDMRVAINDDYDRIVYLSYSPSIVDSRILEDDTVTFYGESQGLYSYESTMGATITIPMLYVQKISR